MNRFNIRVYGICINERSEVLLSDEQFRERSFTKFPGGGLEFGEGMLECLKREFLEEFELEIQVNDLFYLTDFFQISAFSDNDQVISVYYNITASTQVVDALISAETSKEKLKWIPLNALNPNHVTFPIDQLVVSRIKENYR
ncbi:MAG TPA: NUDIX hydrolase [Fluviicola sp.]|nr:NUDIX hydrolase [Fluviicola sp.]